MKTRLPEEPRNGTSTTDGDIGFVLVSWMRDFDFWRTEARRSSVCAVRVLSFHALISDFEIQGLDLASLTRKKRLAFVDGLSSSSPPPRHLASTPSPKKPQTIARTPAVASTALPIRGPPVSAVRAPATPVTAPTTVQVPPVQNASTSRLTSLGLNDVRKAIEAALASLDTASAILILDAPDLLLALQTPDPSASIAAKLQSMILSLRGHPRVHATILSLAADVNPLPSAPRPEHYTTTPLETESQALLVGLTHGADLIISARGLDTGSAGDVGGVLRVTVPGAGEDEEDSGRFKAWKEQELLYLIKTDGSAKVWERGAGVGVG